MRGASQKATEVTPKKGKNQTISQSLGPKPHGYPNQTPAIGPSCLMLLFGDVIAKRSMKGLGKDWSKFTTLKN